MPLMAKTVSVMTSPPSRPASERPATVDDWDHRVAHARGERMTLSLPQAFGSRGTDVVAPQHFQESSAHEPHQDGHLTHTGREGGKNQMLEPRPYAF